MSMNLMLSTRAGVLERWLRGLDKLFVTHRTIGLSVAVLITSHFLLVPKSVGFVWSKPFGYTAIALFLTAIFIASAPRFPWRVLVPLNYQTWKLSHRFMGILVALAVTHSLLASHLREDLSTARRLRVRSRRTGVDCVVLPGVRVSIPRTVSAPTRS